jgi:transposase
VPEATGRPAYHPATMLKIYVYGYINQIQSSRRLERETGRNGGVALGLSTEPRP